MGGWVKVSGMRAVDKISAHSESCVNIQGACPSKTARITLALGAYHLARFFSDLEQSYGVSITQSDINLTHSTSVTALTTG